MRSAREKNYEKHISAVISDSDYQKLMQYKIDASEDFNVNFSMGDIIRTAIRELVRTGEEKQKEMGIF